MTAGPARYLVVCHDLKSDRYIFSFVESEKEHNIGFAIAGLNPEIKGVVLTLAQKISLHAPYSLWTIF